MTKIRLASPIQYDSIVDGPGVRCVVWTQGCPHNCKGCHNPQTHEVCGGFEVDIEEIILGIENAHLQSGLTLSGGEPFLQSVELIPVCNAARNAGWNIWAYSGFTFEELQNDKEKRYLLSQLDVLVDGKFMESLKDYRLKFKGSKNQRIINVPESLRTNKIVLSKYDDKNQILD